VTIAGRNGDTIRSLTRLSKAKIVIDKQDRRNETLPVVINLSGTAAAIDTAKVLLFLQVFYKFSCKYYPILLIFAVLSKTSPHRVLFQPAVVASFWCS